jgi:hypothetical protein
MKKWFDQWEAINDDLRFTKGSLALIIGYSQTIANGDPVMTTAEDLERRVDRIQKNLEVIRKG